MKRVCFSIVLVLLFVSGLSAQSTTSGKEQTSGNPQGQVQNPDVATQKDLEKSMNEIKGQIRKTQKDSEKALKAQADALNKEAKASEDRIKADAEAKANEAKKIMEAQTASTRKTLIWSGVAVAVSVLIAVIVVGVVVKRKNSKAIANLKQEDRHHEELLQAVSQNSKLAVYSKTGVLDVRQFVSENPVLSEELRIQGSVSIPSVLILEKRAGHEEDVEGKLECVVILYKESNPHVVFPQFSSEKFAWKNRNVIATGIVTSKRKAQVA